MEKLNKVINKFLDGYIGDGITCKVQPTGIPEVPSLHWGVSKCVYSLYSDKGILILSFKYNSYKDSIIIFRGLKLCNMVCRFFSITDDDAMRYVRTWFADKYGMKKLSDLTRFIPQESHNV